MPCRDDCREKLSDFDYLRFSCADGPGLLECIVTRLLDRMFS